MLSLFVSSLCFKEISHHPVSFESRLFDHAGMQPFGFVQSLSFNLNPVITWGDRYCPWHTGGYGLLLQACLNISESASPILSSDHFGHPTVVIVYLVGSCLTRNVSNLCNALRPWQYVKSECTLPPRYNQTILHYFVNISAIETSEVIFIMWKMVQHFSMHMLCCWR